MKNHCLFISRLQAIGKDVPVAEIKFGRGLNVVSGVSNTGKSYIFQAIDFMFGAETPPERIEESRPYHELRLEIHDINGRPFVLERDIRGGDFRLYEGDINNIDSPEISIKGLKAKFDKDEANISSFLLSIMGFQPAVLKKNANNEKVNLSFRTISQLFLVSETRIIDKSSPIFLEGIYNHTLSKSAFNFLLTSKDDSSLITYPDKKILDVKEEAKREVLDKLINELEKSINDLNLDSETIYQRVIDIENNISFVTNEISESSQKLSTEQEIRRTAWEAQQESASRLISIAELMKRFELLKQHYQSDLTRLDFIAEGDHYFEQLETVNCPLCGSPLTNHEVINMCQNSAGELIDIQTACREEALKIQVQLIDLEKTMKSLSEEEESVISREIENRRKVEQQDNIINSVLMPKILADRMKLNQYLSDRKSLFELELNKKRLEELWVTRASLPLLTSSQKLPTAKIKLSPFDTQAIREFCNRVEQCLKDWKYLDMLGRVDFNDTTADIVINGKDRRSNGKGVRALIYSAFVISLMRYCKEKSLPHPSFVVLDSPLTTFKERSNDIDNEEVPGEVQMSFFDTLSSLNQDEQVIIFDNKEPSLQTRQKINFIQFFGKDGPGRCGFFPV